MRASRDPRYQRYWPLRYHYPRMSRAFYVSLCVGHREFIGDGQTRQAARHNAAQKALRILKNLPVQNTAKPPNESVEEVCSGKVNLVVLTFLYSSTEKLSNVTIVKKA